MSETLPPEMPHLPQHIAIIMDGNGRWAEKRGLPRFQGHLAGLERARSTIRYLDSRYHTRYLTFFGFSTENWRRPAAEVSGLLGILEAIIDRDALDLHKLGIRLRHLGRLDGLSAGLQAAIKRAVALTKDNPGLTFSLAFNYGGRAEIVDAVRRIAADKTAPEEIDEALIGKYLYTSGMPDVDLLIRPGGELRTSNFLTWQSVYSELYFTDVFWPDFDEQEVDKAIFAYQQRKRRFGGL